MRFLFKRISKLILGASFILMATLPARSEPSPVVIELFTSQGCSSCPTADAYLVELAKDPDLITLSFAIDYWDYLGWEDTLALDENIARQRDYNMHLYHGAVYTPEVVINGSDHAIGSRHEDVARKINEAKAARHDPSTSIVFDDLGRYLKVALVSQDAHEVPCDVYLLPYQNKRDVNIKRGENRGRTLSYTNVVRAVRHVGVWLGGPLEINYDRAQDKELNIDGYAVLIQEPERGPIVAAARFEVEG